jgi:hypothetical protein
MTYKLPKSFVFRADAGHGWLIVARADLAALGLTEADITPYSYQNGDRLALEEDCDAQTFVTAYEAATGTKPRCIEQYAERSRVRNWRRFGTKRSAW